MFKPNVRTQYRTYRPGSRAPPARVLGPTGPGPGSHWPGPRAPNVILNKFFKYKAKWKLERTQQTKIRLVFYHDLICFTKNIPVPIHKSWYKGSAEKRHTTQL